MNTERDRIAELIKTDPEYGGHKQPPCRMTNWMEWNRRRRKGEHRLLQYLDVEDRLLWFNHEAICIHYGDKGSYPNRVLLVCKRGLFEFSGKVGHLICRRNMWADWDEDGDLWSHEDLCLTMIFQFQTDPTNFTDCVGCRSNCRRDDHSDVRNIFDHWLKLREVRKQYRKFSCKGQLAAHFMMQRKRMEVNEFDPTINPYLTAGHLSANPLS